VEAHPQPVVVAYPALEGVYEAKRTFSSLAGCFEVIVNIERIELVEQAGLEKRIG
jgi:hypothetical protein